MKKINFLIMIKKVLIVFYCDEVMEQVDVSEGLFIKSS